MKEKAQTDLEKLRAEDEALRYKKPKVTLKAYLIFFGGTLLLAALIVYLHWEMPLSWGR